MLDYVDRVNVRPLINILQHISAAERDRQGLFGENPCTQRLRLAYLSDFYHNIYVAAVQVRPLIGTA